MSAADRGIISPLQAQRNAERESLQQLERNMRGRILELAQKYPVIPIPKVTDPWWAKEGE